MENIQKKADCIRIAINNSTNKDFFKFDKSSYDEKKIKDNLEIASPKLLNLINNIKELDDNDFLKYGKKFKHIIYSDLRNSIAGIKVIASVFKAYGMNNIYDNNFKINIKQSDNNFALLSSMTIYSKPFPVKLRNNILKLFNSRPDNIFGDKIRYLLLDQGFKEGIDVFDVKYIHIFDELITPSDEKQVIGRGTRFCGQKGLIFNPTLGWPLHVFKYKLILSDSLQEKYGETDAFSLYLKESGIDIKKLNFAGELENICRFGAVDYEINRAIHEYGNEKEDKLDIRHIVNIINDFQKFPLKDIYLSFEEKQQKKTGIDDFDLANKAKYNFGGKKEIIFKPIKLIKKNTNSIKIKPINKNLNTKLNFIDMRKYIRKYYNEYKWNNVEFENLCIPKIEDTKQTRIVELTNSQLFVSNFFISSSPYKGILFWHSVGTGKTCSAIATASNSFEKNDYTILWVTRHTLKPDIWKNIYNQVCSITIKEKLEKGEIIPENPKDNQLKYLDNKWVMPISYKQFTNLIEGKNKFYLDLVKRNGKEDPLKKTLIIIDEAHKIFSEETPKTERPNITSLKKAIYNSYSYSKNDSCRLLLMTATPYTNDPLQLFKLLNLLKEDDYLNENFDEFKEEYLDENYKFTKNGSKNFLDKISGYISYLNRERDVRQFAYPVIYTRNIEMSSNENSNSNSFYELFFEDIKDYILVSIPKTKEIISNLNNISKTKIKKLEIPSQETTINDCLKNKKEKNNNINEFIKLMKILIKLEEENIKAEEAIYKKAIESLKKKIESLKKNYKF
jgi:superfamily II DNA or RNA helicase